MKNQVGGTANDFIFVTLVIECNTLTTKQQVTTRSKRTSFIMLGLEP